MKNQWTLLSLIFTFVFSIVLLPQQGAAAEKSPVIRVGIIGLDSPHASAFAKLMNDPKAPPELSGCKVVAAYTQSGDDLLPNCLRYRPKVTAQIKEMGIEIVPTIAELLKRVDVVLLETQDGRPHLKEALPVIEAGKPIFVDKPVAASLVETLAIYDAAKKHNVPIFSSSSLRYMAGIKPIREGKIGKVMGCTSFSPCPLEKTHADFYWYGIHGVEILCTVMGPGCESVNRIHSPNTDVIVGAWKDGRLGTCRGRRKDDNGYAGGYGGIAFGTKGVKDLGGFSGYDPLVVEIVKFFKTRKAPVSAEATIEIYALMEAADESKRRNGAKVTLKEVIEIARKK